MKQRPKKNAELLTEIAGRGLDIIDTMSDKELRDAYTQMHYWGPGTVTHEHSNSCLNMMVYEMNRRENDRSFKQMWRATWIAIGLAVIQSVVGILQFWACK